jgi:hypothetical protein
MKESYKKILLENHFIWNKRIFSFLTKTTGPKSSKQLEIYSI